MAESLAEYAARREKEKKAKAAGANPSMQADALEGKSPAPAASPSPAASPKPKTAYKGTFDSGSVDDSSTSTKYMKSDKGGPGMETTTTKTSSTPALDAQKKAARLKTLGDAKITEMAKGGDFEAREEARTRKLSFE